MATTRRRSPAANAKRIAKVIAMVEGQMEKTDFKATIADYIRLLQIEQDFENEQPRDIEVMWIDSLSDNERSAA